MQEDSPSVHITGWNNIVTSFLSTFLDLAVSGVSIFCENWVFLKADFGILSFFFYKNAIWVFFFYTKNLEKALKISWIRLKKT